MKTRRGFFQAIAKAAAIVALAPRLAFRVDPEPELIGFGNIGECKIVSIDVDDLEDIFNHNSQDISDLALLLSAQFEVKMCGCHRESFYDYVRKRLS